MQKIFKEVNRPVGLLAPFAKAAADPAVAAPAPVPAATSAPSAMSELRRPKGFFESIGNYLPGYQDWRHYLGREMGTRNAVGKEDAIDDTLRWGGRVAGGIGLASGAAAGGLVAAGAAAPTLAGMGQAAGAIASPAVAAGRGLAGAAKNLPAVAGRVGMQAVKHPLATAGEVLFVGGVPEAVEEGLQRGRGLVRNEHDQPTGEGRVPAALRPITGWFGSHDRDIQAKVNDRDWKQTQSPNLGLTSPDAVAAYQENSALREAKAQQAGVKGSPEYNYALQQEQLLDARNLQNQEKTYGQATEGAPQAPAQASQPPAAQTPSTAQQPPTKLIPPNDTEIDRRIQALSAKARPEDQANIAKLMKVYTEGGRGANGVKAVDDWSKGGLVSWAMGDDGRKKLDALKTEVMAPMPEPQAAQQPAPVQAAQGPAPGQLVPTNQATPPTQPQQPATAQGAAEPPPPDHVAPDASKAVTAAVDAGALPEQAQKEWQQAATKLQELQKDVKVPIPKTKAEAEALNTLTLQGITKQIQENKDLPDFAKSTLISDVEAKMKETGNPLSAVAELSRLNQANVKGGLFGAIPQFLMEQIGLGEWWGGLSGTQQIMLGIGAGGLLTGVIGHLMGSDTVGNLGLGTGLIAGGLGAFGSSLPGVGQYFGGQPEQPPAAPAVAQNSQQQPAQTQPGQGLLAKNEPLAYQRGADPWSQGKEVTGAYKRPLTYGQVTEG